MQEPRGTKREEFEEVLKLVNYVFRESRNEPPNMGKWYPLIFNYNNLENMRIVLEDGKVVSHIGISESKIIVYGCTTKLGSIGSVCTHPEYRGRGLASLLLKDAMEKLDRDGVDIMLVSGGRGLYRRAGCVEAGIIYEFRVPQDKLKCFNFSDVELFPYKEEYLEEIVKLYQEEPVRFHRSLEDFRMILSTGAAMNRKAQTLLIRKDERILGYLVSQLPTQEGERKVSYIAEYSGARGAILDAIGSLFDRYGVQELILSVPFYDEEFVYLCQRMGLDWTTKNIPGHTVKIINLPRLMERFCSYLQERLGKKEADLVKFAQEGDSFIIQLGKEQAVLDQKMFTQIVFGNKEPKVALKVSEKISKILRSIFPLPLVWPGLNYV